MPETGWNGWKQLDFALNGWKLLKITDMTINVCKCLERAAFGWKFSEMVEKILEWWERDVYSSKGCKCNFFEPEDTPGEHVGPAW